VLVVYTFLSASSLLQASLCRCPWFDKANNIYWREQLWSSHLFDTIVVWTSVLVTVFKSFNCVLKHTHKCCTTGTVVPTFIFSPQHFHLTHVHCMYIFLVILYLITLMTFREQDNYEAPHYAIFSILLSFPLPLICLNTLFSKAFLSSDRTNIKLYKVRSN